MRFRYPPLQLRPGLVLLRLGLLYSLACFLVLATGLQLRSERDKGWGLAAPSTVTTSSAGASLPFLGITVDLTTATPAQRSVALTTLQESGFGWVRQRLDWGQLEPTPGHYDWSVSDALITDMVAQGLVPVIVLDGSPAWARDQADRTPNDNPFAPPADPATFARFAAAFATRYQQSLRFYQLWDEPNIAPHAGNRLIEPVVYAQMLKATVPLLRAADPDALIITAALAPTRDRGHLAIDEIYFLQRLYAAGAAPFFDVVATQPFGFGATPADSRAQLNRLNFQRIQLVRRVMLAAGDGTKPIWAVRYGWNTHPHSPWRTVTPADQSVFATDALTLARQQWPWLTAMGWAIDQPTHPSTDPLWGFALTPPLREVFQSWANTEKLAVPNHAVAPVAPAYGRWGILVVGWVLLGWRTVTAWRRLPWMQWQQTYTAQPSWWQAVLWALLISVYYLATWPPLIGLCWLLATLLLVLNPFVGLGLAAFCLPFYFQHKELQLVDQMLTVPPAHVLLLCLGLALLARRGFGTLPSKRLGFHSCDWLALAWIGISLLSGVNAWPWPAYGHRLMELVLLPCLAYGLMRSLVTTPARQTWIIGALFAGGLVAALLGLLLWSQGQGTMADGVLRLVGPYFSPNHTALYLERTLWLGVGLALSAQGNRRRWLLLATGLVGIALVLTASRGAWILGVPAGLCVFGWYAGRRPRSLRMAGLRWAGRYTIMGVVVLAGILAWMGHVDLMPLWERLTNSATIDERLSIWQATIQLWRDHWLVGVGPGGFFWHYPRYLTWPLQSDPNLLHPHNLWLELLAGWGVLGLSWVAGLGWQARRLLVLLQHQATSAPPWQLIGLLAALAAGIAHGQVDTFAALPDLAIWNWLAWGLLVNGARRVGTAPVQKIGLT